jgi:hypothetical protein
MCFRYTGEEPTMMISRWWYVRWRCPACGQVFIIPAFDVEDVPLHRCSWCGEEVGITGTRAGAFQGAGALVERFPRLDITVLQSRREEQLFPKG